MVGDGVPAARKGERVWVWNGQWKRPFGTCAEYVVLPSALGVASARIGELRGRRLPRHPGDDGLSRRGGGQCRQGIECPDHRRRRRRRPLRHPVRQGARRDRADHRQLRGQGRARPAGRRRPHHRLQARERRRTGHGAHRQDRRRCGGRDGSRRQRQALSGRAASARPRRGLWHRQRGGHHPGAARCWSTP